MAMAPPEALATPLPGEWPTFKRDLAHTGLAVELKGGLTHDARCLRWSRRLTFDKARNAASPVVAKVAGRWTVFQVTQGTCRGDQTDCIADGGTVYALDGANGVILWKRETPFPLDPYAPAIADVDRDGNRELLVPANAPGGNVVYAVRTEPADVAGELLWTATYDAGFLSEGAPVALNVDPSDDALEVLLGTASNGDQAAARFYAFSGKDGSIRGAPFEASRRSVDDPRCEGGDKLDSSSPSVAWVDGAWTIYVGSWGGRFYGLEWADGGLRARYTHDLPRFNGAAEDCSLRKVRSGAAIGQIVPGGDPEVVFGYMTEPRALAPQGDFSSTRLRIVNANGLATIADLELTDWKSSPSLGELDAASPGLEIVGGRVKGVYSTNLQPRWNHDLGDGDFDNNNTAGNRASPAIADVDGDGKLDVVMGIEGKQQPGIVVLDGQSGELKWGFEIPAPGLASSPIVADIDGDGQLEIVFWGFDGVLYALDNEACQP